MSPLHALAALLEQRIGLAADSVGGLPALRPALAARLAGRKDQDAAAYVASLAGDPAELARLVDEIVVPETWFFRDRTPYQHLAERFAARLGHPLRILSAPCATGEEPYSIAITLHQAGFGWAQMAIDAIDVSEPLLARARLGCYGPNSFRGGAHADAAYFLNRDGEWQVEDRVRAVVKFEAGNLLQPLFLAGKSYDAIFCRNVLIYFTSEARERVVRALVAALAPNGVLYSGHAERLDAIDPRLKATGGAGAYAWTVGERGTPAQGLPRMATPVPGADTRKPAQGTPVPRRAITPSPVPQVKTPPPEPLADPLQKLRELADRGELAEARRAGKAMLVSRPTDAALHHLLGVIALAAGDVGDAEACFQKTIYLDPRHTAALVQLALLCEARGDIRGAQNFRRRAAASEAKP